MTATPATATTGVNGAGATPLMSRGEQWLGSLAASVGAATVAASVPPRRPAMYVDLLPSSGSLSVLFVLERAGIRSSGPFGKRKRRRLSSGEGKTERRMAEFATASSCCSFRIGGGPSIWGGGGAEDEVCRFCYRPSLVWRSEDSPRPRVVCDRCCKMSLRGNALEINSELFKLCRGHITVRRRIARHVNFVFWLLLNVATVDKQRQ